MINQFKKMSKDFGPLIKEIILFNKCKICVEIGVAFGTTTEYICAAVNENGGHVYGYDLWSAHGLNNQFVQLSDKLSVEKYLNEKGYNNFTLNQINTKSDEFKLEINKFDYIDFAFIDGCHSYEGIKNDFDIIYPK